jgi:hypothetical protein
MIRKQRNRNHTGKQPRLAVFRRFLKELEDLSKSDPAMAEQFLANCCAYAKQMKATSFSGAFVTDRSAS